MLIALQNNHNNIYENEFRTSGENPNWLRIRGKIKHDENGIPIRVIGVIQDITEKKIAEIKIQESEKNFRMLADQAPMWIWLTDDEVNVLYANTELLNFVGISHYTEFTGKVWEKIVHPDDIALVYQSYNAGASRQESFDFECRVKNATSNEYEWIFLKVVARREADKFAGFVGTAINIHHQKTHLFALEESEERFRMLAETLPALVWVTDEKGEVEYISGKWKEYTGLQPSTSEDWASITHPDDIKGINQAFSHSLATGDTYKFDVRLKSKTQKYRWFTVSGVPLFDDNNNIVKWIGAFMDIQTEKIFSQELENQVEERTSELKIVNDMLLQRNDMLSISESFNRNLTEVSPNIVYIHDLEKNTPIFLNRTGLKLIGFDTKKVQEIDNNIQSLIIHPDDLPFVLETIEKVKKDEKDEVFEHEYRIKNSKGNWTPILARDIAFKRNRENEVTQLLGIAIDITEIKKAKNNLEQKNQELEKMNKELESFAYVSSHDLQEPLRKIQTFANRILENENKNLSENGKNYLNRMRLAAERMQQLINDLLAYSRTKVQERKFENIDLKIIFQEVEEDFKDDLSKKYGHIEIGQSCHANIIPFQFRQLIYNLISNSIKFGKINEKLCIKVDFNIVKGAQVNNDKLIAHNEYCHISIADNGIGFNSDYKERIFEIFQRLHGREEYSGTGIGLAIVKKIVDNHNGIITAEGELNVGATFNIYLPSNPLN